MLFLKTPNIIQWLFPKILWKQKNTNKTIYLTFDDGPIPIVTEFVLDELEKYNAKATFFCIGDNIQKYPSIFELVKQKGHSIGNHTFNHLNGWKNTNEIYFSNVEKCQQFTQTNLFRPPYGKMRYTQYKKLSNDYQIVFWNILSYDFDKNLNQEKAFKKLVRHTKSGSILVFHDSWKAFDNLNVLLPRYLEYFSKLGYKFEKI